ncbi:hypothetical protein DD509_07060 [Dehalogenimonas alkenigignens]|nr:hypothetical protein DD509_07060 [Dehalogenimonas alkenigignens]
MTAPEEGGMAFCTSCGNTTSPNDKFCASCGQPTALPPAPEVPELSAANQALPAAPLTAAPPKRGGFGTAGIILSIILVLALGFGGFAAWQWMDNSSQVKDLTTANESLTSEKADLSSQVTNLSSQVQTLTSDKSKLETDKAALTQQVNDYKAKYPLKNFATEFALQSWLLNAITKLNPLDDYPDQYYMLQRLAETDGYFLSVAIWEDDQFYYPELYAVAGNVVYVCYEDGSIYPSFYLP